MHRIFQSIAVDGIVLLQLYSYFNYVRGAKQPSIYRILKRGWSFVINSARLQPIIDQGEWTQDLVFGLFPILHQQDLSEIFHGEHQCRDISEMFFRYRPLFSL
jgi:hypothetical protein